MDRALPELVGVEHEFVNAAGLRMHVASAGPADGDPVVLLHGWPQHWFMWRGQIPALAAAGFRVICPDLRGLGWTEAPWRGYRKEQMASDVLALLDAVGRRSVFLAGHDWGGFVAYLLALREPSRVRRLLVLNMIHPWARAHPDDRRRLARRFGYQSAAMAPIVNRRIFADTERIARHMRRAYLNPDALGPDAARSFAEQFRERERVHASAAIYRAWNLFELPAVLAGRYRRLRLELPVLNVHGVRDAAIAPHNIRGLERHGDDVTQELVPDSGHFIAEELPELVTERMLAFFG